MEPESVPVVDLVSAVEPTLVPAVDLVSAPVLALDIVTEPVPAVDATTTTTLMPAPPLTAALDPVASSPVVLHVVEPFSQQEVTFAPNVLVTPTPKSPEPPAKLSKTGSLSASSAKLALLEKEEEHIIIRILKDQPNCCLWGFVAVATIASPIALFIAALVVTILYFLTSTPATYLNTMITLWVAFGGVLVAGIALVVILLISYLQERAEKKHDQQQQQQQHA